MLCTAWMSGTGGVVAVVGTQFLLRQADMAITARIRCCQRASLHSSCRVVVVVVVVCVTTVVVIILVAVFSLFSSLQWTFKYPLF